MFKHATVLLPTVTSPGPDPAVSDCEVIREILLHPHPAIGTADVADLVDVSRQAADRYLRRMKKEGLIDSTKVGTSRVWWVSNEGRRYFEDNCRSEG